MKIDSKPKDAPTFRINSSYQSFTNRQKNVFEQLDIISLSPLASTDVPQHVDEYISNSTTSGRQQTKQFSGKESIFKKPLPPTPRTFNRKVPDYQRNPHKWTKYSLEDVPNEDMSDRSNTATAMSFLKELALRNEQNLITEPQEKFSNKILFKKVSNAVVEKNTDLPIYHPTKIVMPEYVIGEKQKRGSKHKDSSRTVGLSKQLKLDHLEENDEIEDDLNT